MTATKRPDVLKTEPADPQSDLARSAYEVWCISREAALQFLAQHKRSRQGKKGAATDNEQDLLRAALIFASSGLDATVKKLVEDALPAVIETNEGARLQLATFVERRLTKPNQGREFDARFLSLSLTAKNPVRHIVAELVADLTSRSLQSKDEIFKVGAAFTIATQTLIQDAKKLEEIFRIRNEINHEMDIDFSKPNRSRRQRKRPQIEEAVRELLGIGYRFIQATDGLLSGSTG